MHAVELVAQSFRSDVTARLHLRHTLSLRRIAVRVSLRATPTIVERNATKSRNENDSREFTVTLFRFAIYRFHEFRRDCGHSCATPTRQPCPINAAKVDRERERSISLAPTGPPKFIQTEQHDESLKSMTSIVDAIRHIRTYYVIGARCDGTVPAAINVNVNATSSPHVLGTFSRVTDWATGGGSFTARDKAAPTRSHRSTLDMYQSHAYPCIVIAFKLRSEASHLCNE